MNQTTSEFIPVARLSGSGGLGAEPDAPATPDRGFYAAVNLVRRRKLLIGMVLLAGTLVTCVAALVVPPSYTATSQFMFEPTQAQMAAGVLEPVVDTHIATVTSDSRLRDVLKSLPELPQYQAVSARAHAEIAAPTLQDRLRAWLGSVGDAIRSALRPDTPEQDTAQPVVGVPSLYKAKESLLVRQERRSNVISVSYKDDDPERAAIIANQIVLMHVERLTERRRQQARTLQAWLDERLVESQAELEAADEALRAHVSAHGTPSADAAAGELTADMSRQLEVVRSELLRRERKLDRVQGLQRSGAPLAEIAGSLREPLSDNPAAGTGTRPAADRTAAAAPAGPTALDPETGRQLRQLEHEVGVLRLQEQSVGERITSHQTASSALLAQRHERQALERRAAAAADVVRDLLRQQHEPKDLISTGVQVLAEAPVPLAPSSLSPYLYIPAAMIAFTVLGGVAASVRERLDRSFRSERDVAAALHIGCIGLIPAPIRARSWDGWLPRRGSHLHQRVGQSVAALALDVIRHRRDGKILVVTSTGPDEGKSALATSIATCAARSHRRVLLVCARAPTPDQEWVEPEQAAAGKDEAATQAESSAIRQDAARGFDCLALAEIGGTDPALLVGAELADSLDRLRQSYDYMIIDAPAVFEATGTSILAARVDGVLFAIRWGRTRRDMAENAIELLRRPSTLSESAPPKIFAVLTHVDLKAHAAYSRGDIGEFLHRRPPQAHASLRRPS